MEVVEEYYGGLFPCEVWLVLAIRGILIEYAEQQGNWGVCKEVKRENLHLVRDYWVVLEADLFGMGLWSKRF